MIAIPAISSNRQKRIYINSIIAQDYDTTDLADFEETIMKGCDFNRDGKISKKELTMILLALSKQSGEEQRGREQEDYPEEVDCMCLIGNQANKQIIYFCGIDFDVRYCFNKQEIGKETHMLF